MNEKKKILILSMTSGFGHIRAGQALFDYATALPNIETKHVDVIDIDSSLQKYPKLYEVISKKIPFLWKIIYAHPLFFRVLKRMVGLRGLHNHTIANYVTKESPDIIIFTNPIILPVFAHKYKKDFPNTKMCVVVTDYHAHPYYYAPFIDYYFVPTAQTQEQLEKMGIKKEKVVITGIPISPRFYLPVNTKDLKLKYGIKNDLPVVLFIASFKISKSDLLSVTGQLLNLEPPINLIFIANGNEEFYTLIKTAFSGHERFFIVKWTNVIDEYMKLADVVISKAGGLTVSECMNLQKPLIMVNPIPGQEEYNAEFVQKNNLGKRVGHVSEIIEVLPEMVLSSQNKRLDFGLAQNPCEKVFQTIL